MTKIDIDGNRELKERKIQGGREKKKDWKREREGGSEREGYRNKIFVLDIWWKNYHKAGNGWSETWCNECRMKNWNE